MAEQRMNFYRSFYDVAGTLPETSRRKVVVAMLDLFFTGREPTGLSRREAAVYNVCAGRISKSRQNAANVAARYAAGGMVSKPTNAATGGVTDAATDAATKPRPEGEGEIRRERGGAGGRVRTESAEPDRAEVRAWFEANGTGMGRERLAAEADAFYDHFSAQGWVTGAGVPISRWQAKASAWLRRAAESSTGERGRVPGRRGVAQAPACDFSAYSAAPSEVVSRG